jgi:formylglycine-generating enzyme required for sulfatase activity
MGFRPGEVLYPADLSDEDRDHSVSVSGYFLDRFEITWARFEQFAAEFGGPPAAGSGAHPALSRTTGWQSEWDLELPATGAELLERARSGETRTLDAGMGSEPLEVARVAMGEPNFAADRLSWFVAFAFCIWDGGRLPTEAEWEYAATGGERNWAYPWGDTTEPIAGLRSVPVAPVGSRPELRGVFGHDDLAGGVVEWAFDWLAEGYYVEGGSACADCANHVEGIARVVRGASDPTCCSGDLDTEYRAASRSGRAPGVALPGVGARCARDRLPDSTP